MIYIFGSFINPLTLFFTNQYNDSHVAHSKTVKTSNKHVKPIAFLLQLSVGLVYLSNASAGIDYSCWVKTFEDEFNTVNLQEDSRGIWRTTYTWGDDPINNELQYYIDPRVHAENPFILDNGLLHIQAKPTPNAIKNKVRNRKYISGLLTTEGSFDQIYGLFELRARLPSGKGLWPAFWLKPIDKKKWKKRGYWRPPEIDILEALGHQKTEYHATLHTKTPPGPKGGYNVKHTEIDTKKDLSKEFHVYGLSWTKRELIWYFDGEIVKREPTPPDSQDDAKYMLINLAVGGKWPGNPDNSTHFPARYSVDWVRVYSPKKNCSPKPSLEKLRAD